MEKEHDILVVQLSLLEYMISLKLHAHPILKNEILYPFLNLYCLVVLGHAETGVGLHIFLQSKVASLVRTDSFNC